MCVNMLCKRSPFIEMEIAATDRSVWASNAVSIHDYRCLSIDKTRCILGLLKNKTLERL